MPADLGAGKLSADDTLQQYRIEVQDYMNVHVVVNTLLMQIVTKAGNDACTQLWNGAWRVHLLMTGHNTCLGHGAQGLSRRNLGQL